MGCYAMTGGATGIGAAIKQQLIADQHEVMVIDIKDADILADLSSEAGRVAAIAALQEKAPSGLDGFIACAGVGSHLSDHGLIASVNYFGATRLTAGVKDLVAQRRGSIVLISSNSAPHPTNNNYVNALLADDEPLSRKLAGEISGQESYSGSKLALARWMRRNTAAFAKDGVRLNAVAPGFTQTPMTNAVASDPTYGDAIKQFMASIPVGRPGQPEDMANAVNYLLSDDASFVCGSVLFVDGGHDAMLRPDHF